MAGQPDTAVVREELTTVEDEIREAESALAELRAQSDGPSDAGEQAQLLTTYQELESLLGNLQNRREELRRRLGES